MKLKFISGKWIVVFLHVLLWALFIINPYIIRHTFGGANRGNPEKFNISFEIHNFISIVTWISLFYANAYVLMPLYFNKKKYNQYGLAVLSIFILLFSFNWLSFHFLVSDTDFRMVGSLVFYIIPCFFILIWSIAYRILLDKVKDDKIKVERQAETLKTELSFLRSQVSPHFMFNVLNNMVSLARKKSDVLESSLIKLASLLRYMLYETDEEKVSLRKEIDYLQSYIDLQQQRFGDKVNIQVNMRQVADLHNIQPMLLIPFVENAFKHGTGMLEKPEIHITLQADDDILLFEVRNLFNENVQEIKDNDSGIGLANVERRLNLLYGDKHVLQIKKVDNWFTVSLKITLND